MEAFQALGSVLGLIWNEGIIRPMLNALVLLYAYLFHNFGLAIVVFTLFIHMLTLPLTLRQIRQTKAMSELQPKMKELQKRFGKDRQRMQQETMRLYREYGVNPIGCLGPLVIQMPILIGLYWAVIKTLPTSPESLLDLSGTLYRGIPITTEVVPVSGRFLWMDLAVPDGTGILAILVAGSMWLQQKMSTTPSADPNQARQQRMMLWMLPIFFAFLAFTLPSGLTFYIFVSNLFRIATQYFITGKGSLAPAPQPAPAAQGAGPSKEMSQHDGTQTTAREHGGSGQDRRRGNRHRSRGARRRTRRSRNRGR